MASEAPKLKVFYDGDCPMCRAEIDGYRDCKGAEDITFVDIATTSSGEVAQGLDRTVALARFHVQRADGVIVSGAAGFAQLWRQLPRWRWLGRLVCLPGISVLAEIAYRGFLLIRPSLQRIARRRHSAL